MARNKKEIARKIVEDPFERLQLLDDEDLNLGSVAFISPNPQPGLGLPERLLDVQCAGRNGRFVTVTFNILPVNNDTNDSTNYSGPIVGIVEFGNGSAFNRVEVDVPNGNNMTSATSGPFPQPSSWLGIAGAVPAGGTAVSVPGSSVRVYARHDGNGRVYDPAVPISQNLHPVQVQAHISYGIRASGSSKLYRTLMAANYGALPVGQTNYVAVPPFAKSLVMYRADGSGDPPPGLSIGLYSRQLFGGLYGILVETYTIAPGDPSPVIPLSGWIDKISVTQTDGVLAAGIFAVFGIGL